MQSLRFPAAALGVLCAASVVTPLAAQQPVLGARSSVLFGGLSGSGYSASKPGYTLGPTLTIPVSEWFAVQTEVLYSTYGVGWIDPELAAASLRQFSIPVLARFDVGARIAGPVRFTLMAGAYTSYTLQCRVTTGNGSCYAANSLSPFAGEGRFDVGPTGGLGISADLFDAVRIGAEVRYQRGFRDMGFADRGLRNQAWSFGFRLSGLGGGGGNEAYLDGSPPQLTLPNVLAPHLPDRRRPPSGSEPPPKD